jgi:hypothetical protein
MAEQSDIFFFKWFFYTTRGVEISGRSLQMQQKSWAPVESDAEAKKSRQKHSLGWGIPHLVYQSI